MSESKERIAAEDHVIRTMFKSIGEGGSACVVKPAFPCALCESHPFCRNGQSVAKIHYIFRAAQFATTVGHCETAEMANAEMIFEYTKTTELLNEIDPQREFTPAGPFICEIDYTSISAADVLRVISKYQKHRTKAPQYQLVMEYAGVTLYQVFNYLRQHKPPDLVSIFLQLCKKILKALIKFNQSGYAHNDIHNDNIVVNTETCVNATIEQIVHDSNNTVKFIDFADTRRIADNSELLNIAYVVDQILREFKTSLTNTEKQLFKQFSQEVKQRQPNAAELTDMYNQLILACEAR